MQERQNRDNARDRRSDQDFKERLRRKFMVVERLVEGIGRQAELLVKLAELVVRIIADPECYG